MNKKLITPFAEYEITNGILVIRYAQGLAITHEIARKIIETRIQFTENDTYPLLVLDMGILSIDKQARDLLSSKAGTEKISASAIVFKSEYGKIAGNFFLKIIKASIPVKMFTDDEKAIEWLQQYKGIRM